MILDIEPVAARARAAIAEAVRRRGRCSKRRAESPQLHPERPARPPRQPTRADERALVLAALESRGDARGVLAHRVVMARYGVVGPQMTLRDVGDSLSLTTERVRQIERAALDTLGEALTRGRRVR